MEHASAAAAPAGVRRSARLLRLASDERLVALMRAGEDSAFAVLYDRHHGPILGFCRHMLGSHEEAEDALQHTFLSAYRDLMGSRKPIDLRPWLFAIARNRCLSLLRARREHLAFELAEPATDGLTATVERREDLREVLADLARLPEDQRAALLLAELGALDHAGIATVLGCPREKVKALVFQARSSLVASRAARATPCEQIRVELATASGGQLRRGPLRRHLLACAGCRAFKAEIVTQRKLLTLALPVVPSAALKAGVLGGAGIGGHGGGAGATAAAATTASGAAASSGASTSAIGGVLGALASTGAAKVAVSAAIVGTLAGGGVLAVQAEHRHAAHTAAVARHVAAGARRLPGGAAGGSLHGGAAGGSLHGLAPALAGASSPGDRSKTLTASAGAPDALGASGGHRSPAAAHGTGSAAHGTGFGSHGGGSATHGAHPGSPHTGHTPAPHSSHDTGASGGGTGGHPANGSSRSANGRRAARTTPSAGGTPAPKRSPATPPQSVNAGNSGHAPAARTSPRATGNGADEGKSAGTPAHGHGG